MAEEQLGAELLRRHDKGFDIDLAELLGFLHQSHNILRSAGHVVQEQIWLAGHLSYPQLT